MLAEFSLSADRSKGAPALLAGAILPAISVRTIFTLTDQKAKNQSASRLYAIPFLAVGR